MTDPNDPKQPEEPDEMVPTHGGEPIVDDPPEKSDVDPEIVERHIGDIPEENRRSQNDLDALKE